jgi:hypothetical protein
MKAIRVKQNYTKATEGGMKRKQHESYTKATRKLQELKLKAT